MRESGILVAARQRTRFAYIATTQLRIGIVLLQCANVIVMACGTTLSAAQAGIVFVVIATLCVVIVVVIVIYARQRADISGNIIGSGVGEISAAAASLVARALW